jgi:hypothetical protein
MTTPIGFVHREPRYYLMKTHVFDRWENKEIDCKDMIIGHECAYFVPDRFVPDERIWRDPDSVKNKLIFDDRMSDERIEAISETSSAGVLERP